MIDPALHTGAIAALEFAVNKALKLDPAAQQRLTQLEAHVFHLQCTAPELNLYMIPTGGEMHLCGLYEYAADTVLKGSAGEFAKLASASDPASALINGELELHGNSQALIELQSIARHLELDWEAPLAEVFGDVVGHQLGVGLRSTGKLAQQFLTGIKRQIDDYLVEESGLLAPRWQVEEFYNEVDQLSMRTERLEARLRRHLNKQDKAPH